MKVLKQPHAGELTMHADHPCMNAPPINLGLDKAYVVMIELFQITCAQEAFASILCTSASPLKHLCLKSCALCSCS